MKLEDQCVSLDLARRLKELGVKQESLFYWLDDRDCSSSDCEDCKYKYNIIQNENVGDLRLNSDLYSAFTSAELGEILMPYLTEMEISFHQESFGDMKFSICSFKIMAQFIGENEVECRAKMLIHLIENCLYEVNKKTASV